MNIEKVYILFESDGETDRKRASCSHKSAESVKVKQI